MATNDTPRTYNDIVTLAEDAADGAHNHEAALGLQQNTETRIRADLLALVTADGTAAARRTAKAAAATAHKILDSNGKTFIGHFIQLEKPRIGSSWGPLWLEAGFPNGSIRIPDTQGDRFVLLGEIRKFLTNHPELVIVDSTRPELDITVDAARNHYLAIGTSRGDLNEKTTQSCAATAAREIALDAMRRRLGGLRDELTQLPLSGDSPLWYAFGFNRPGDPATPGIPENLTLAAGASGSGTLIADWAPARRATGYRVKIQIPGEAEPRVFGLFADDQTTITGLPAGVLLTVTIAAHNARGDGPDSTPATITLP